MVTKRTEFTVSIAVIILFALVNIIHLWMVYTLTGL